MGFLNKEYNGNTLGLIVFYIIIGLILFMCSCDPCKRLVKKCPPSIKDSIVYREIVSYRDTTIWIDLPSDTVRWNDTIYIIRNIAYMPLKCEKKGIITACAWVQNSRLFLSAHISDSSYKLTIDSAIKDSKFWYERWRTEKTIVEVKYIPWYAKAALWWTGITSLCIIGYVVIKLRLV